MAGISDFNVAFARNRAQTALDGWLTGYSSVERFKVRVADHPGSNSLITNVDLLVSAA